MPNTGTKKCAVWTKERAKIPLVLFVQPFVFVGIEYKKSKGRFRERLKLLSDRIADKSGIEADKRAVQSIYIVVQR